MRLRASRAAAECPLFPKADVQIGRNWVKLGAAFGQKRALVMYEKPGAGPAPLVLKIFIPLEPP